MTADPVLLRDVRDGVLTLTLNRPHRRNAINGELWSALRDAFGSAAEDASVRAVGAGWNLALLCDLIVASPNARFPQIFAKRGLSLDFGGSWLLPRALAQTKELLHRHSTGSLRDALAEEARAKTINAATDAPAAYRAFRDGAEPEFTGRLNA